MTDTLNMQIMNYTVEIYFRPFRAPDLGMMVLYSAQKNRDFIQRYE